MNIWIYSHTSQIRFLNVCPDTFDNVSGEAKAQADVQKLTAEYTDKLAIMVARGLPHSDIISDYCINFLISPESYQALIFTFPEEAYADHIQELRAEVASRGQTADEARAVAHQAASKVDVLLHQGG